MNPPNLSGAAADLYRACDEWLEWLEGDGDGLDGAEHERLLLEAMHAATAKARREIPARSECAGCGSAGEIRVIVEGEPLCDQCRQKWIEEEGSAASSSEGSIQ